MSEEQAIETEDEIVSVDTETPEAQETEETPEVDGEVEIVVTGEEQPTSKAQVPIGLRKRFNKLNGKIQAADTKAEEATRKSEMLAEENKLLRLQAQQGKPATRPDEDDFDTRKEYLLALDDYDQARISVIAQEQAAKIVQASQTQATSAGQDEKLHSKIEAHYDRANKLKMSNFVELEDKAIDVLGNDFAKTIIASTAKSHLILAHLGANVGKAQKLAELAETDPVGAFARAVEIGAGLSVKPKNPAPDPEKKLEPGGGMPAKKDDGPEGATYV
jgi:hypothetical protein